MEDFFVMMLIVWAVGILSIILFFKLWRMTNDIKKICISVVKEPQRGRNWVVSTMLMKGESPEMISKYLIESFSEAIHRLYKVGYTEQAFTQYANAKITQYKKLYELIGIEMPDSIQNANTITKVKTIFHQG